MSKHDRNGELVVTISCPDTVGIVAAVTGVLAELACNILESAQFDDLSTGLFFLRIRCKAGAGCDVSALTEALAPVAERFRMKYQVHDASRRARVLLMVSKFGHCLNDLLHRYSAGLLPIEVPAIVSNHRDFYQLAAWHNIPFHHLQVNGANKLQQEERLREIIATEAIDVIVLARYMQVLSAEFCRDFPGRIINIHHSFLPSFKGAKPYHQAHARGVKLIGATAHYVTEDLDEGPIIEQEVERVDHNATPEQLVEIGCDIESIVLARALRWHIEHRVLLNGQKTVVFR